MEYPQQSSTNDKAWNAHLSSDTVLIDAVHYFDIVHISLAGMTAIVILLLTALSFPVFDYPAVKDPASFSVMVCAAFIGILGLYLLNFRVHKHVINQARLTEVLVNSLGQAFVIFGPDGTCGKVYSQACLNLLETVPAGQNVVDVLRISKENQEYFLDWLSVLYQPDHALSFDDVVRFFPDTFPHSLNRRVILEYRPLYNKNNILTNLMLIATDVTTEYAARQVANKQQNFAEMVCKIFQNQNQFRATLAYARDFINKTAHLNEKTLQKTALLRELHTLKASLKQFNLMEFSKVVHYLENDLRVSSVETNSDFIKVLMPGRQKMVECLAEVNDEVCAFLGTDCEWHGNVREVLEDDIYAFARELTEQNVNKQLVSYYVEKIVAVPIRDCFRSFERELMDLIGFMDKQIFPLSYEGCNPKILAKPLQPFFFTLTHICRNIADHGIEPPVTRMARDKNAAGQVTIITNLIDPEQQDGRKDLQIIIKDDGNGIDPAYIREKLSVQDPQGDWCHEDDQSIIQRIFSFGFTTKKEMTAMSGQGVGMDVVEQEVHKLGGTISVRSELYKGTEFEILIPYDLSL